MIETLDHLQASERTQTDRIGWICWQYISETCVEEDQAKAAFRASGLPPAYALPDIRPVDAYRRASKSLEGTVPGLTDDDKLVFLVRDVYHDRHEVVRHLVLERKDQRGRRLAYVPDAAKLIYDHARNWFDTVILHPDEYVVEAVTQFETRFRAYRHQYDASAKRRVVQTVLKEAAATALKESGGVYLVPRTYEDLLFALLRFLDDLPGCKGYKVSVENTVEGRDMVRDAVTRQAQTMLAEMRGLLTADTVVPQARVKEMLDKSRRVKRDVETYQAVLQESIGSLGTDVEILEAQMMRLLEEKL